jgi:nitrous oxidase accessory protein
MRQSCREIGKATIGLVMILSCVVLSPAGMAQDQHLQVSARGPYTTVGAAVAQAKDGATIHVYGGRYTGPLVVDKRLTLVGHDWPVIDGNGQGTVVKLQAPGIVLSGFVIRNSGSSLDAENSGIAVEAPQAVIAHNRLEETLFGIYLRQASASVIRGNVIHGKDLSLPRRGDAIRVWYSNEVQIEDNRVERGRDVVLWYSKNLTLRGNVVRDGRYGMHFMYCDDAHIELNRLMHNSVGAFLMYSRRLRLRHNLIAYNRGPSGYGVGLKDMDDALIEANVFVDNRVGAYIDNSPREIDSTGQFRGNVFAYNTMGLSLLPSVRRNWFVGNSFVDNQEQVNVGGGGRLRDNVWTEDTQGNYWSDYVGYDANGDGIGDVPYRAERLFEDLLDRYPALRLFVYSPAVQAIEFAARALPFVKPQPKLIDTSPRMAPHLPAGLPALPRPDRQPLLGVSLGLLLVTAALTYFPRLASRKRVAGPTLPASGDIPMIAVQDLTKRFGTVVAVEHVSFVIQPGEAVAFWGPNGAGKTTILRCLLGLLPYDGTIQLAGYDVTLQGKAARRLVGFVPQELHFHDELTVEETMRFYSGLKKMPPTTMAALLERLELTAHAQKPVRHLSGGLKQRLALAVALLADPPCLVLDEPTANLDTQAREAFLHLLRELKRGGKTLLFSSHRQEEVLALSDRVLLLAQGRLVADATPAALRQRTEWQTTLRLQVPPACLEPALTTLAEHGFLVSRNGQSVRVRVAPGEKGAPLHVLMRANIPVRDFGLEHDNGEGEAHA